MANNDTFYNLFSFFFFRTYACFTMLLKQIHTVQPFFFLQKKKYIEECMRDFFFILKIYKIVKLG